MRFSVLVCFSSLFTVAHAQQLIFEEDFNAGIPLGWYIADGDGLIPAEAVDSFDNAWIPFIYEGDTCAASTSYYTTGGQSADYLITPRITLDAFSKLVWSARSYDASYPDGYAVLISTTDSLITSFTDTVFYEGDENYYWQTRSVQLDLEGYASEDVFIAFRNVTTNGFILMLDDVKVLSSDFASVAEAETEPAYTVYPNPATETLTISNLPANATVACYSMQGQLLFTGNQSHVDVSTLQPGYYYLVIQSADAAAVTLPFIHQ